MVETEDTLIALPIRAGRFALWAVVMVCFAGWSVSRAVDRGGVLLWFVAVVLVLSAAKMVAQWLQSRGGELRLSPDGLQDTRYLAEPVLWNQITSVGPSFTNRLIITFTKDAPNRFRPGVRHWHEVSRKMKGAPALQVSGQGFKMEVLDVARLIRKQKARYAPLDAE